MGRTDRRWRFALPLGVAALSSLLVGLAGCGPTIYVSRVTRQADSAVAEARTANAAKYSPYWWTRAIEYLHQARVEGAAADFQAANRFGQLAADAAERARDEALERARLGEPGSAPATELAPVEEP